MFKSSLVGVGYVAIGLVAIVVLRSIMDINISPAIAGGVMAGTVIFASQQAYKLGKKDGMSAGQKVEVDRADEGEEN